jgi:hypothetical protein
MFNVTHAGFAAVKFVEKFRLVFPIFVIFSQGLLVAFDWQTASTDLELPFTGLKFICVSEPHNDTLKDVSDGIIYCTVYDAGLFWS